MDRQGLTQQQLADMSGVAVVTVRDLCSGKRWPWTSKRNAIEVALGWETGRIAAVAKGNAASVSQPDPFEGLSIREALQAVLARSPLSQSRQLKVVAYYLDLEEQQEGRDNEVRREPTG